MGANLRKAVTDLARQPLVHFLVIAAAIAVLYGWLRDGDGGRPDRTIRITSEKIDRLEAEWRARWKRAPTAEELDGLIRAQVREAALYREALAMGLNEDDPVIRRVLVRKLEGIARDIVEISLSPTEQDLAAYFEERAARYRQPPLVTFTHVFIDPDRRGERTLRDADEILAELQSKGPPAEDIGDFGDPFMLQRYYPEKTEQRVASLFGREFARSVFELQPGRWHGPVLSGYGTHLVYVDGRREFPAPTLAEVEERVRQDWIDEKRKEITEQYFAQLLARYEVIVERESTDEPADAAAAPAP
jgi:parvulin-like peptidyl-prolyl isomerase